MRLVVLAALWLAVPCRAGPPDATCPHALSRLGRLAAHLTPSTADDMFTASATAAAAPPTRPHILLAVADDLGWNDVGSFNPGPRTPAAPTLDGLMAQGVKLKQHYSVSPPQHSPPTSRFFSHDDRPTT